MTLHILEGFSRRTPSVRWLGLSCSKQHCVMTSRHGSSLCFGAVILCYCSPYTTETLLRKSSAHRNPVHTVLCRNICLPVRLGHYGKLAFGASEAFWSLAPLDDGVSTSDEMVVRRLKKSKRKSRRLLYTDTINHCKANRNSHQKAGPSLHSYFELQLLRSTLRKCTSCRPASTPDSSAL